jgi:beta-lactamase regulating signal transducer with metallopeptidase domain
MVPGIQSLAQVVVGRMINSLPEGILIALGAWILLRLMRRQNSETRFDVWLIALSGIVALPFLGIPGSLQVDHPHSVFVASSFWALTFLVAWVALACLALARLAVGLWKIRQIRRTCTELRPADLDPVLRELIEQNNRPICLLVSDEMRVPAAIGFRKPAVVIPAWALREIAAAGLRPILIHELAHLRRYDNWTNLFQKAVRALFFFHPAVWWIEARLSLEREMACDDAVLQTTADPHAYAGSLICLLEKSCAQRGWTMAQAAVARAREASQRISRILSLSGSRRKGVSLAALGLATALLIVCGAIALSAPHLLAFTSDTPLYASRAESNLVPDRNAGLSPGAVVPAAFHVAHRTPAVRSAEIGRTVSSRRLSVRPATLHKKCLAAAPIVVASISATDHLKQQIVPAFVVISTSTTGYSQPTSEAFAVDPAPVQERHQTTTQIQMLQFVQADPDGRQVLVVHILIAIPAAHSGLPGAFALII